MDSHLSRGASVLALAALALAGGVGLFLFRAGAGAPSRDAAAVDAAAVDAATTEGASDALSAAKVSEPSPPDGHTDAAAVDLEGRIAALKQRYGASVTALRGRGWAVVEAPSFFALLGRTSFAWCRSRTPKDVDVVVAPPEPDGDGGLLRFRNPTEIARFATSEERLLAAGDSPCPADPKEYLSLIYNRFSPDMGIVSELRGKGVTPKSAVFTGLFCRQAEGAEAGASGNRLFVCRHTSLVYDIVDDTWEPVASPPERPYAPEDIDKDGKPEFPRTLVYFTTTDIARPETALEPLSFEVDAYGFETWDGQGWSMAVPSLRGVYKNAYSKFESKAFDLQQEQRRTLVSCSITNLEALAKATVSRYMQYQAKGDSPIAEIHQIEQVLAEMVSPDCFAEGNPRKEELVLRYNDAFNALSAAPVPAP